MPSEYSPFDKDIEDLKPEDLVVLRSVNEGWYVEYKRELTTAVSMAKAISAFANTYGGWLFIGIDEAQTDTPIAGEFVGISQESIDTVLQQLRQAASTSLNPTPFFRTKVLRGPCPAINLAPDNSIVVVHIPSSLITPHVHKDGRIYRRVADSSEPKPETDRFVLDQLWRRGNTKRKSIRKWITRDPEFSKMEVNTPYLRFLLCVDPWQQKGPWVNASISDIRSVFKRQETGFAIIPFDTVYSSSEGIIARQLGKHDPELFGLTWKIRRNLSSDVVLPLPFYDFKNGEDLAKVLDKYENIETFVRLLHSQGSGYSNPRIVDLNIVLQVLMGVASKYRHLLSLVTDERVFHFKARILNCWRTIPFVDVVQVLEIYETYGIPMVMEKTLTTPDGYNPDSFAYIDSPAPSDKFPTEVSTSIIQGICIFIHIAMAFGIPTLVSDDLGEEDAQLYGEYFSAGNRAKVEVENQRN